MDDGLIRSVARFAARLRQNLAQRRDTVPVTEIAETFFDLALFCVDSKERFEDVRDLAEADSLGDDLIEPGPLEIAADIDRIEAGNPADNPDIAAIGPRAAIGAAGDTDRNPFLLHAPARHPLDDLDA